MEPTRLRVKVGVHEFDAEGPAEQVTAQFEAWKQLIAVQAMPTPETQKRPLNIPPEAIDSVKTRDGYAAPWDIFGGDEGDLMTLKAHPPQGDTRDADAILLVLYGYRKAGNDGAGQAEVPVTKLKESLDVSGIRIARIDRAIAQYLRAGFVLKSGRGKGGVYRLTNTGFAKAEDMARKLFEQLV